jgi:hypothetical protein
MTLKYERDRLKKVALKLLISFMANKEVTPSMSPLVKLSLSLFLNWYSGGGIQFGPLGTAATNWPTVPAPGDYDDRETGGMMIGRGNRNTRRKPAPVPLCPPQTLHAARRRTRAAAVGRQLLPA